MFNNTAGSNMQLDYQNPFAFDRGDSGVFDGEIALNNNAVNASDSMFTFELGTEIDSLLSWIQNNPGPVVGDSSSSNVFPFL